MLDVGEVGVGVCGVVVVVDLVVQVRFVGFVVLDQELVVVFECGLAETVPEFVVF